MLESAISLLNTLAVKLPLSWFCFIGSFVEEIIGPIPSPVILMTSGSLIFHRHNHWFWLIPLAMLASAGKTLASWLVYYLFDKAEDILLTKFGKLLGMSHKNIEKIGAYFSGTWKDDLIVFIFRAVPILPTTTLSAACGFIKLDRQSFIRSTFVGFFVRSLFLLYLGYAGIESISFLQSWLAE